MDPNHQSYAEEAVSETPEKTALSVSRSVFGAGWLALLWERLWPLLVPPFIVASAFACISWFGLWPMLPGILRWVGVAAFAIAFLASLWPLRSLALPTSNEVIRRVERQSELQHRPISTRRDKMAFGDSAFSRALWEEHQNRMSGKLSDLKSGMAKPDANRFDRFALRAFIPILAVVAFGFSFGSGGGSLTQAFAPAVDPVELRTRMDAWVNPPAYTRVPPIYLSDASLTPAEGDAEVPAGRIIDVPQGSEFYLRFVGNTQVTLFRETPTATGTALTEIEPAGLNGEEIGAETVSTASQSGEDREIEYLVKLEEAETLVFTSGNTEISRWQFTVIEDAAPTIAFTEEPSAALSGSLQLNYEVGDDYGVVTARGDIRPLAEPDKNARPLIEAPEVKLSLPRSRAKSGSSKVNRDLTQHPWAGSRVALTLIAIDDAEQEGRSEVREIILPGRSFTNPLARAVIEQRRDLAMDANQQHEVADMLDVLGSFPEFIDDATGVIAMRIAYRRVKDARSDDELRNSLDFLWEVALGLEFGDLSEAERRLREAQENLSEALENNASDEEIAELMQELREAMEEFIRQLAEQSRQNPMAQNPFSQNEMMQTLRQRDLDRMMDQIEDLARSGSKDAAREMLSELQRMMDNLRAGRHQQQRQAEGSQTNQALDKLSELMQRQEQLMDETSRLRRQQQDMRNARPGQQQQPGQQNQQQGQNGEQSEQGEGQQGEMSAEELAEALERLQQQQEQLQNELGQLGQQLEDLGLDPSQEFGEAGEQMGEAGENLGEGNTGDATGNQAQALDALRRGAQSMMQQMAGDRQQGGGQEGEQGQAGNRQQQNDPLGRRTGENGLQADDSTRVPGEVDAARAREIMEAIRKRLSDPLRPFIERDYLERLLDSR